MIVFDLLCECGVQFEGWFDSREAFEEQQEKAMITCPQCGHHAVTRVFSPFSLPKHTQTKAPVSKANHNPGSSQEGEGLAMEYLRQVSEYVQRNYEDVGTRFANESLKMHYGVVEQRNIRGVATEAEEKMLQNEGVEVLKVPVVGDPGSDPEAN